MGRVNGVHRAFLELTVWERLSFKEFGPGFFSNMVRRNPDITYEGKFTMGTPVKIWTWTDAAGKDKAYVQSLDAP